MQRWINSPILWGAFTILTLIVLLAMQIYWFIGSTTLKDFERLQKEYQVISDDISRIKAAGQSGDNTTLTQSTRSLIEPLFKKQEAIAPRMQSAVTAITTWNKVWEPLIFWSPPPDDSESTEIGAMRNANDMTQVLNLYLLPLLFGTLGSLLWIMQRLREEGVALEKIKAMPRLVTGIVAGPMIGMFISPEFLSSLAVQATPFVLAFLSGYSTDLFFAVIDRILCAIQDGLGKPNRPGTGPAPAGGNAGQGAALAQGAPAPGGQNGAPGQGEEAPLAPRPAQ